MTAYLLTLAVPILEVLFVGKYIIESLEIPEVTLYSVEMSLTGFSANVYYWGSAEKKA